MDWLLKFGSSLYFPAFQVAFGSLVLLCLPLRKKLTQREIEAAPQWYRWLLRHDWERWAAWLTISISLLLAAFEIAMRR